MKHLRPATVIGIAVVFLVSISCNFPTTANYDSQVNMVYTQAANTIVAKMTNSIIETYVAEKTLQSQNDLAGLPSQTATSLPLVETPTQPAPTLTVIPILPTATNTPIPPTNTARPLPCDWAQYVDDITIEDGEQIPAGQGFYKVWRLKNIGACTWTPEYDLVFAYGDRMDGVKAVPLTATVPPGSIIDVAVYLYAPDIKGTYQGFWKLRDESGNLFGIGPNANGEFYVDIEVVKSAGPLNTPYDFVANYCDAKWSNDGKILPCPGNDSSLNGFVIRLNNPWLEKGGIDDEPALWVHPEFVKNGSITGEFPALLIQDGDHLVTTIGCLKDAVNCKVVFSVYYSADGGGIAHLGSWTEVYDKSVTPLGIDLSFLKGKSVVFYFVVDAHGSYKDDDAFWLGPSVH